MQWVHLPNRDGMFAVFDRIHSSENGRVVERRVLKLIHGSKQLVCCLLYTPYLSAYLSQRYCTD